MSRMIELSLLSLYPTTEGQKNARPVPCRRSETLCSTPSLEESVCLAVQVLVHLQ
jgi:hypothetical protein